MNTTTHANVWMDSPQRYGIISRILHWGMAYLLIWQFISVLLWRSFGAQAWVTFLTDFGPYHGTVGLWIISLVIARAIWWGINCRSRPSHTGWQGRIAMVVHTAFYGLMFTIPALALLRAYGSGKGWSPWIVETGVEIAWMVALANALHSPLSWMLGGLITVHIGAVIFHKVILRDRVLARMAGPLGDKNPQPTSTDGY